MTTLPPRQERRPAPVARRPAQTKRESAGALPREIWSGKGVSNSRPQPWQGCALPTELFPRRETMNYSGNPGCCQNARVSPYLRTTVAIASATLSTLRRIERGDADAPGIDGVDRDTRRAARCTCALVRPEYENMPRCVSMKRKSDAGSRSCSRSTSAARISLMRSRIVASSASHSARSSGERQHRAPRSARRGWADSNNWRARSASPATARARPRPCRWRRCDSAPTRSPYSENDFENELDTNSGPGVAANAANDGAVFVDAVGEALVGDVEKRHQAARADDLDDARPLRRYRIDAGRIVAARVQHDDRSPRHLLERRDHPGESRDRAWPAS